MTTVAQDNSSLLFIEFNIRVAWHSLAGDRVTVEKALHRLPIPEVRGYNISRILWLHMGIEDAIRLDDNIWALLAEAMTPGKIDLGALDALFDQLAF
ncbi:hypothetical protein ES703_72605 [subsurface metagenome]